MRPTRYDVDLDALRHNVGVLSGIAAGATFCAVVKADGCGHGAVPVARAAVEAGADWLAVALVEEAAELRVAGIDVPLLMLSEPRPAEMAEVAAVGGLRPVLYTAAGIDALAAAAPGAPAHLMVDTGMHRAGVAPDEAVATARHLLDAGLRLEGVATHFAVADEPDDPFTGEQLRRFDAVLADLGAAGIDPGIVHAANSAGTIAFPDAHRSMVRVGISLFGVAPSPDLAATVDGLGLRLVGSLRSEVTRVAVVEPGETVSYGRRWQADRPTRVATVPIGYADGVPRAWWERGAVLVGGRRRPIRGVVTMDQLMVEVDDDVAVGDEVVLLGSQGEACVRPEEVADAVGSIAYEVLTSVGARVPRRH